MADASVLCPLRECDFAKQDGLDPPDGFPFAAKYAAHFSTRQLRFVDCQCFKAVRKFARAFHRKSSADFAGIMQRRILAITQIESPQGSLARPSAAVAENNELLSLRALGFQPGFLASSEVRRVRLLGDNSFQPCLAGFCKHLGALAGDMFAIAKRFLPINRF